MRRWPLNQLWRAAAMALQISFYRAMPSTERGYEIACCPSVRLFVTIGYRVQIGWNSSKIISRPNNVRSMSSLTPNIGGLVQWKHP